MYVQKGALLLQVTVLSFLSKYSDSRYHRGYRQNLVLYYRVERSAATRHMTPIVFISDVLNERFIARRVYSSFIS